MPEVGGEMVAMMLMLMFDICWCRLEFVRGEGTHAIQSSSLSKNEMRLVHNSFSIGLASMKQYLKEIREASLEGLVNMEDNDQEAMVSELYRYADRYVETVAGEPEGKGKEVVEEELEEREAGLPLFFPDGEDDAEDADAEVAPHDS